MNTTEILSLHALARWLCLVSLLLVRLASPVGAAPRLEVPANFNPKGALGVQNVQFQLELHVDGATATAADTNSGTAQQPFKTLVRGIKAAFEAQAKGQSVRLRVHPGIYREEYDEPFRWGNRNEVKPFSPKEPRVLIEAVRPQSVVMTGADVFSNWKPAENGFFTHEWTRNMREVVQTKTDWPWYHPLFGRAEGVIINGKIARQVYERSQLKPGRFWVDDNAKQVLLSPPAGVDPRAAKVEMITRHKLFQVWWKRGLTIRGIDFVHAGSVLTGNSTYATSVGFWMGADITLEDCRFDGNASGAVGFANVDDISVRRCTVNDNGFGGIGFNSVRNVRVEDSETSGNHWRGAEGWPYGWAGSALRMMSVRDVLVRNHVARRNNVQGIYFDTDCVRVMIDRPQVTDNFTHGVYLERCQGPLAIRNGVIARNAGSGVWLSSRNVALENNIIYDNGNTSYLEVVYPFAQVSFAGHDLVTEPMFSGFNARPSYPLMFDNFTMRNNVIASTHRMQPLFNGVNNPELYATYRGEGNLFYHPSDPTPFHIMGKGLDFKRWQEVTAQDLNSTFANPRFTAPVNGDFKPLAGSPLLTRAKWPLRRDVTVGQGDFWDLLSDHLHYQPPFALTLQRGNDLKPLSLQGVANAPLWPEIVRESLPVGGGSIFDIPILISKEIQAAIRLDVKTPSVVLPLQKAENGELPKIQALYYLVGAGYVKTAGRLATLEAVYDDGTTAVQELYRPTHHSDDAVTQKDMLRGNIQDAFWKQTPLPEETASLRSVPIWTYKRRGSDEGRYGTVPVELFYFSMLEWRNPQPQKAVRELRLRMAEGADAQVHIPAITALTAPGQKFAAGLTAVAQATSLREGQNVLPQGAIVADAAGRPTGWEPFIKSLVATVGQENGRNFARIKAAKGDVNLLKTHVELKPEWKALRVRGKARISSLQTGDAAWKTAVISGLFWDEKWNMVARAPGAFVKDKGWHDYSLDWPIPAGAVRAELSFGLHESIGEVDFAEFEVVPLQ
jgi:hypothetical protein